MRALLRAAAAPTQRRLTTTTIISAPPRGTRAAASPAMAAPVSDLEANPVLVVYVTCPDAAASDRVIDAVVPTRLAACVNIVPGLTSVYRWKGEVKRDAEALLIMKTRRSLLPALTDAVVAAHPYDTPEVLALPAVGGSAAYLQWVADETGPVGGGGGGGGGGGEVEATRPTPPPAALPALPTAAADDEAACLANLREAVQKAAGANLSFYQDAAAFEALGDVSGAAVAALQAKLGHAWAHPWLLRAALTHKSWRAEAAPSSTLALLAWVGDAALQGIVTDELVARYARAGGKAPTELAVTRSHVLSRAVLARHARALGLDATSPDRRLLAVGGSFKGTGSSLSVGMLGEAFEALVGAVYVDAGRAAAREAALRLLPFPPTLAELGKLCGA